MIRITTTCALAFAVLCGTVRAEENAGIPNKIIKALDTIVGTWEVKGIIGNKTHSSSFTLRWVRGDKGKKYCLLGRTYEMVDGVKKQKGITLIGWNAVEECIEDRGFSADGGNARLLWKVIKPGQWEGRITIFDDGKLDKQTGILIWKSPTEIVSEGKSKSGEPVRLVFRKEKDAPKRKNKKE